jgi:hypothetical protein
MTTAMAVNCQTSSTAMKPTNRARMQICGCTAKARRPWNCNSWATRSPITDNRHGLVVNAMVTQADGHAEREAAKVIINGARQARDDETILTLRADKGYGRARVQLSLAGMYCSTWRKTHQDASQQWPPPRDAPSRNKSASTSSRASAGPK